MRVTERTRIELQVFLFSCFLNLSQYKIPLPTWKCWFQLNNSIYYIFWRINHWKYLVRRLRLPLCSHRVECNNCETGEQCGAIMHGNAVTFCEPYGPRELVSMCYLCTLFQIHCLYLLFWQQRFSYSIPIQMKCAILLMSPIANISKLGGVILVYFQM